MSDAALPPLEVLKLSAPAWAPISQCTQGLLSVNAAPLRASGKPTRVFFVDITCVASQIEVREGVKDKSLPLFCPERHINSDGSFCLGLNAGQGIDTVEAGALWWDRLELFLLCQETAYETRQWPVYAQMSHGDAGAIEARAEEIARELGRDTQYYQAVRSDTGPIAEWVKKLDRKSGRLRNGWLGCLCGRTEQRGRPMRRHACRKLGCLIELEFQRREATKAFWAGVGEKPCCQTMRDCPLRNSTSGPRVDDSHAGQADQSKFHGEDVST